MRVRALYTYAVLINIVAYGVCEPCCEAKPNCKGVSTLSNLTIQKYVELSPFYFQILSTDSLIDRYASGCTTFFPISNNIYLQFEAIVYKDGTLNTKTLITSAIPGLTGSFRVQGLYRDQGNATTVYNAFIVDAACSDCKPVYIQYKCYLIDDCFLFNSKNDAVSSSETSPPSCLDSFESLVELAGLNVPKYARLSGPHRCVVHINNNTCVNGDRVSKEAIISLPGA